MSHQVRRGLALLAAVPLVVTLANAADAAMVPSVSLHGVSVTEGASGTAAVATFRITLSAKSSKPVQVTFHTEDGTATAGTDYAARTVTVKIPAGRLSGAVGVTVYGDETIEPDETFSGVLTSPVNATLRTPSATGTITNDDFPPPPPAPDPTIVTAGDIGCESTYSQYNEGDGVADECHQRATSDLAVAAAPDAVLTLGDDQYESGALDQYQSVYDSTWGRLRSITHPVPGNHDYLTAGAAGYFGYFGPVAGDPASGWYSFDIGAWHVIALNSNCAEIGGCYYTDPEGQWLTADLQAHPNACVLAYWHQPRFSSGAEGDDITGALYRTLVTYGADVVLTGHDHLYERFAQQDGDGVADANGPREFIVGTGGRSHFPVTHAQPNSEVVNADTFGVLSMTLHPTGYDWAFHGEPGTTFTDSGSASCH